jgi:hypothetical protein
MRTSYTLPSRVALALCATLTACGIGYAEPVLSDEALTFEPRLVGTWDERDSEAWVEIAVSSVAGDWRLGPTAPRPYAITYHDEERHPSRLEGWYGPFDGWTLMQVRPTLPDPDARRTVEVSLLLRLYAFVEIIAPSESTFALRAPQSDSIVALVRRSGGRVPFFEADERMIITASRDSLQAFLREALRSPGVWGDTVCYRRRRP